MDINFNPNLFIINYFILNRVIIVSLILILIIIINLNMSMAINSDLDLESIIIAIIN